MSILRARQLIYLADGFSQFVLWYAAKNSLPQSCFIGVLIK